MILHGRNIILLAGGTAVAAAKSCELNVSAEVIKTASPSDGAWENAIAGRKSWRVTCNQLVTSITNGLAIVGTQVTLRMSVMNGSTETEALQGTAIVKDWKITATLGNLAQGSFQFHGVGALEVPTT